MISFEINKKDLMDLTKVYVRNLPGAFFVGTSPLLKPFMKKLECMLPPDGAGKGDNYIPSALQSHISEIHANESSIIVKGYDKEVEICRDELTAMMHVKYPSTEHQRLNLPGLLFLQSSPSIQVVCTIKLRSEHKLRIPDGRRTLRYIFHMGIVSIDAKQEFIRIGFDANRLPKKSDGSGALE
ncbi:MAG: hypothetical protein MUO26_11050 [Methanotrichaceae archaeon]|nr:hypothetical protein [Methanotrichaceae archaeon]